MSFQKQLRWLSALACLGTLSASASAQAASPAVVQVTVADESGGKVPGADLVLRNDGLGLYFGTTDGDGKYVFVVEVGTGHYSLVARKLGYLPKTRDVALVRDSVTTLTMMLGRSPMGLDTVRIVAEQLRSKNYRLDGSEIGASSRMIVDALDAIKKLRPSMLGDNARQCPLVHNVWVNGKRIFWSGARQMMIGVRVRAPAIGGTNVNGGIRPIAAPSYPSPVGRPATLDDILRSIKAEHVSQALYVNCWDTSVEQLGTNDALFITLKPGIVWDEKNGTHASSALSNDANVSSTSAPARYPRLLGVFDYDSGSPIDAVEIRDSLSGMSRFTSPTGTLTLGFVPLSGGVLQVLKTGYVTQTIRLSLVPSDSAPITLLLTKSSHVPPPGR